MSWGEASQEEGGRGHRGGTRNIADASSREPAPLPCNCWRRQARSASAVRDGKSSQPRSARVAERRRVMRNRMRKTSWGKSIATEESVEEASQPPPFRAVWTVGVDAGATVD